jgi:hypothetical protein
MTAPEAGASLLVATLEQAWAAIRGRHPEVPEAIVVVAAGGEGRRLRWGHFAAGRWQLAAGRRPEVLVGGEGLRRPAREVLGTLLHEAAHGLADRRGIQDTSRGGRYHNRRYRQLAEEVGLQVACVDPIGWSATTVPEQTAHSYAELLAELEARLTLAAPGASRGGGNQPQPAGVRLRLPAPHPRGPRHPAGRPYRLRGLRAPLQPD